ncbi:virulence-associated E family protein [Flavobacterium gawalongense]|uniref:VapE domain-containing protein n=1 Tax=Flavobacterium gawalongense TaxID=2594432 RepID=UPI001183F3EA|nr:VapE domain-containing protein [Flavobacterium gawalongense]TRX11705.1 virulence-associated E family protein [Flavobacterium gawalongense]TRX29497.1 virulence-associated E family protein [Flavobacterium gawalongense]
MVTVFKNFNEVVEHKTISTILEEIKTGKYKHAIVYLRKSLSEKKEEAYNKAKKSLPAFTPSGKFVGGRKLEYLAEYSNCIILDIDKLSITDLQNASHLANQSEFTYASFISPSGNGLKILVKINSEKANHKEAFLLVQAHYEGVLKLEIDKSGKDVTRLCFYSFDENLYINENASFFVTSIPFEIPELVIPSAIEGTQPEPPTDYYAIYNHCIKFTEKKVQYANGSRNVFVHQLACNLNRKGVALQEALGYILTDFGYDEKEVTQAVNSAYGNLHEFAKNETIHKPKKPTTENRQPTTSDYEDDDDDKPKPTQIDRLELFLSTRYVFRHNIVSGKLEFQYFGKKKWNVMNDFIENSMLRECLKGRIKTNLSSLRNLLYSDFCELFNPFEDYFFNLPTYDEKTDYITELANTITTTKQDLWQQCFKKWLVAMVGCVLDDKVINHTVIVFSGKQGLGKTTWVERLVPKQLKEYLFSGTINPNNKDTLVQLAECMLINLDELENLNRSEIGSLKEIITKTQIRMRKAYGHNNETMPRRASFAGSVNTAQFLNDSTGSRRFLCFELEDIQYQHNVDINLAFSQALFLFKSGFRFWFDQEEIKSITENNEQYQLHSPEEELLLTWFEPCEKEKANTYLNASQIAAKLAEKAKINITDGTINKLGKALKKHNFIRLKKNGIAVYALIENTWEDVDNRNKVIEE